MVSLAGARVTLSPICVLPAQTALDAFDRSYATGTDPNHS
jgi:hypothetical protein